jgi:hypothetical protein
MKKIRKRMLLAGLFAVIFLVSINAGWAYGYHGWGYHHHGWGYHRYYEPVPVPVYPYPYYPYYYHYGPAPYHLCYSLTLSVVNLLPVVERKPYVMDVIYDGRVLYKAVPRGERRLLRMRSCASFTDERMVTIDVKDSDGNFIGTVSRPFYVDSSRAEVWNITLNDLQR